MAISVRDDGQVSLGPWPLGLNNRQPDHALPEGSVRNAVNLDFDNAGWPRRRAGMVKVYDGLNTRAGFSCEAGTFFVEADTLKRLNADNSVTALLSGVIGESCAYCFFNGVLYFSDGIIAKKIVGGSVTNWGMTPPTNPGLASVHGAAPGAPWATYLVASAFYDEAGNESGPSQVQSFVARQGAGVAITNLPGSSDPQVAGCKGFASEANGSVLYDTDGRELVTQHMNRPPPGRIIRQHGGRMYIASGPYAYYTEAFSADLVAATGFYQFPADITIMEPVADGIWIVADRTYFIAGNDPTDSQQRTALDYGAIFGTAARIPNSGNVAWLSQRGIVMAGPGGEARNIQEANAAPDTGTSGAMIIREADGLRQALTSIRDPSLSHLAARSFIDAEVIRRQP